MRGLRPGVSAVPNEFQGRVGVVAVGNRWCEPLRDLGSCSRVPVPGSPLVGRDALLKAGVQPGTNDGCHVRRATEATRPRSRCSWTGTPRLTRFAMRMLGNREDAEDATQESFSGHFGRSRYEERQVFRTWLFQILRKSNAARGRSTTACVSVCSFVDDHAVVGQRATGRRLHRGPPRRAATRDRALDPDQREAFLSSTWNSSAMRDGRGTGVGVSA